jgi:hypothetical protein
MIGAERLFIDRQRALVIRSRFHKIALRMQQTAEIVEAQCGVRLIGADRIFFELLPYRPQPAAENRDC